MSCKSIKTKLDSTNGHSQCFTKSSAANENGKRFSLINTSGFDICKVRVDGCLIADNNLRKCDYFFSVGTLPEKYFLVELKGVDLSSAVKQLEATYDHLEPKLNAVPSQFKAVIVASAVPSTANQEFRKVQEKLYQSKKLELIRKSFQCELSV